jgi:hypothetical protein
MAALLVETSGPQHACGNNSNMRTRNLMHELAAARVIVCAEKV